MTALPFFFGLLALIARLTHPETKYRKLRGTGKSAYFREYEIEFTK